MGAGRLVGDFDRVRTKGSRRPALLLLGFIDSSGRTL